MQTVKSQLDTLANKIEALIKVLGDLSRDDIASFQSCESFNSYLNQAQKLFSIIGRKAELPKIVPLDNSEALPPALDLKIWLGDLKADVADAASKQKAPPAPSVHDQGDYLIQA